MEWVASSDNSRNRVQPGLGDLAVYGSGTLSIDEAHAMAVAAGGLVLPGQRGCRLAHRLVHDRKYQGRLWLDAIRYLRRSEDQPVPRRQQQCLIDEWLLRQQDLGVTELLTAPDRVLGAGQLDPLQRLLNDEEWPEKSRVVLPLDSAWLANCDQLVNEIRRSGRPVAVALRDPFDPVASLPRVRGLVALSDPSLDLMLLRTDSSAVGALAFGMRAAAVGVSTYTRHVPGPLRPPSDDRPLGPTGTDVYIPALGAHHRAATLQMMEAVGSARLQGLDICRCRCCVGRSLTRFAYVVDREAGRAHDVASVLDLGSMLRREETSTRTERWLQHCAEALSAHQWLRTRHDVAVPTPKALAAWVRFGGLLEHAQR